MSEQEPVAAVMTYAPKRVPIANIESGLAAFWAKFNQDIKDGQTVMRACMSNLIIYCDTPDEAGIISEEIAAIVEDHPARILLLTGKGDLSEDKLESAISIYYTQLPDGWQVCAEKIDILSNDKTTTRLPSVARALLIGDLPTALWWASKQPAPEAGEVFFELAEMADQIIYDNMGWAEPAKGIATMTRWVAAQQDTQVIYNLAWRRLAFWRRLIRQVLDPQAAPNALNSLHLIEIEHGPHALAMAWLLVGWLAAQLKWKAISGKGLSKSNLVWRFQKNNIDIQVVARRLPKGKPLIYRMLFTWRQSTQDQRTCFVRLDNGRIGLEETLSTDAPRVFPAQIPARSAQVSAQLAHRSRDKVFEKALKASNSMSAVFQK